MTKEAKSAAKREKKLKILLAGYQVATVIIIIGDGVSQFFPIRINSLASIY